MPSDFRHALRNLVASPGFAFTAMLTLALGLAAVSTIFAVVETVMFRPLAFPHSERIVTVSQVLSPFGSGPSVANLAEFQRWEGSGLFKHAAAVGAAQLTLLGSGRAERLFGVSVSPDFFRVFEVRPFLGRGFEARDAMPGQDSVIVLSHSLWMSSFGGDPLIIGKVARTDAGPMTVIGVMPPRFDFPRLADVRTIMYWAPERTEFWTPLTITEKLVEEGNFNYYVIGRLKDDVTPQRAAEQCRASAIQIFRDKVVRNPASIFGQLIAKLAVYVVPLRDTMSWGVRSALWMLLAAVGLLLMLVLFNLSNLLLTRNAGRLREFVVREALGATRWHLFRQGLAEPILVVAGASLISLAAAEWGVSIIRAVAAARIPRLYDLSVDARVTALLIILSLVIAALFGALPLLVLRKSAISTVLQSEGRGATGDRYTHRLKSGLMILEIAISTVLLIGAGLLIRSFTNVMRVDPGFDPHNLLNITVSLNPKTNHDPAKQLAHIGELLEALRSIPGVESATVANEVPLAGEINIHHVNAVGKHALPADETKGAEYRVADASYFNTMRIPIIAGRGFRKDEPDGFALVNRKMASHLWPRENAVGKQFRDGDNPPVTVIGVVGNVHDGSPERETMMQFYLPLAANPWCDKYMIRTRINPATILPLIQQSIWRLDPEAPVSHPQLMEQMLESTTLDRRFETDLVAGFAATALFLAMLGLFSMASLSVATRTREFGIRLALGATGTDLVKLEMSRTLWIICAGLACGIVASAMLGNVLVGFLYGLTAWNPLVYGLAIVVLLVSAFLAAWLPARHAARIDPAIALRHE